MDKRFMLISVCDREILTERFHTHSEALSKMHEEMVDWGNISSSGCDFSQKEYEVDGEFAYGEWGGYANNGTNHQNIDWLIVDLWGE